MVIPPLGKHYLGSFSGNDNDLYKKKITNTNLTSEPADFNSTVKQEGEDSEFTPLVDRIFGCLIEEEIVDINTLVSETPDKDEPFIKDFGKIWPKPDIPIIEDRIKQELFDLGIIDDEKVIFKIKIYIISYLFIIIINNKNNNTIY